MRIFRAECFIDFLLKGFYLVVFNKLLVDVLTIDKYSLLSGFVIEGDTHGIPFIVLVVLHLAQIIPVPTITGLYSLNPKRPFVEGVHTYILSSGKT
jgi:hypothetical protein